MQEIQRTDYIKVRRTSFIFERLFAVAVSNNGKLPYHKWCVPSCRNFLPLLRWLSFCWLVRPTGWLSRQTSTICRRRPQERRRENSHDWRKHSPLHLAGNFYELRNRNGDRLLEPKKAASVREWEKALRSSPVADLPSFKSPDP